MKIFLDDVRETPLGWTPARTAAEFKHLIERSEQIEAISFDHDLGESEPDGYSLIKWLSEARPELLLGQTEITIHSANPVGRENIESYIEFCRRHAEQLRESNNK